MTVRAETVAEVRVRAGAGLAVAALIGADEKGSGRWARPVWGAAVRGGAVRGGRAIHRSVHHRGEEMQMIQQG